MSCHPCPAGRPCSYLPHVIARLSLVVVLLLVNAFFVVAEFALIRVRRSRLEVLVRGGERRARFALRAASDLGRMLTATQIGITLTTVALGFVAVEAVQTLLAGGLAFLPPSEVSLRAAAAATIAVLIVVYLHVAFGELVPRAIGIGHPETLARWVAPPLLVIAWILTPLAWLIQHSARFALRLVGQGEHVNEENALSLTHSADQLRLLVEEGEEGGTIEPHDADMIDAVFEFSEKTAREVMTPRTEIVGLPMDATLEETIAIVDEGRFSRYPVFDESIDDIVGIVLAKDLLTVVHRPPPDFSLRALMREAHVVPGSREVEDVLADFKRLKEHMAVVLDEFGGTAGVVTMEDLLEEIVGEIFDEHDEREDSAGVAGGEALVQGTTHIADLNERFALDVPEDEYTSIGGFVFGTLGRLPAPGDRVSAGGAIFTVRSMDGRRIDTIALDLHSLGDRRGSTREPSGTHRTANESAPGGNPRA